MMKHEMCNESQNAEQINDAIRSLTYRPEEVMAFSGENVTSFVPKTGKSVAEKFIVTTKTKHDIVNLPANARNIHVKAQGAIGLIWEKWRTSIDRTFPLVNKRIISISGTTLNQKASIDTN